MIFIVLRNVGLFEVVQDHTLDKDNIIVDITLKGMPVFERKLRSVLKISEDEELRVYFNKRTQMFTKNNLAMFASMACSC